VVRERSGIVLVRHENDYHYKDKKINLLRNKVRRFMLALDAACKGEEMPRRQTYRDSRLSALEEDILTLLVGRDLCAQEIIQLLAAAGAGHAGVVQSTPYSVLPRMQEKGFVHSRWSQAAEPTPSGSRRRYYRLTEEGLRTLQERRRFRARLDALSTSPEILVRRTALNRCLSVL
jgi:PadR family transcriptional regulator, regulatory protein PadR